MMKDGQDGSTSGNVLLEPREKLFFETPFLHVLFEPCLPVMKPIMGLLYSLRWGCLRPMKTALVPLGIPYLNAPGLRWLSFISIGEALLALPIAGLLGYGAYNAFVVFHVERSGFMASYLLYLTFLTASKSNSLCSLLFGIPFPRMVTYHNLSALAAVACSCFHTYTAYRNGGGGSTDVPAESSLNGNHPDFVAYLFEDMHNTSGSLLVISLVSLVLLTQIPFFRQKCFDLWLWTHIGFALCTIVFCILHGVTLIFIVAVWWGADVVMRYIVMAGCRYPKTATITKIQPDVVGLSFPKPDGFKYNAGQFVQISVPELGVLAFHPLSISSAPHEPNVTVHVKACGGWSDGLLELADEQQEVGILVEGPYGCLSLNIDDDDRYPMALCVSGGIGVTHCQSVAKSLLHEHVNHGRTLKQLSFVWAVRDMNMLQAMPPLEAKKDLESTTQSCIIENEIYVTTGLPESAATSDPSRQIHAGRPDLDAIVAKAKLDAEKLGVSCVAVFGCGPASLVEQLKVVCRSHNSKGGVRLDVHEEIFGV